MVPETAKPKEGFRDTLELILSRYPAARNEPFTGHPIKDIFHKFEKSVTELPFVRLRFQVEWGVGQGKWTQIPWLAILDPRETITVQKGVYCILLFRDDCSGVYVTLNQGITELLDLLGAPKARLELASRADSIRKQIPDLLQSGFQFDNQIDLHTSADRGLWYQHATIAYKFYQQGAVPADAVIVSDLENLVRVYSHYVDTRAPERAWIFQANPEFYDIHGALAHLRELTWLVQQHRDKIRTGDKVYLWVSGKEGGISGLATVTTDPAKIPANPEEQPFTIKPRHFAGEQLRVRLRIESVLARPLSRTDLMQVPALQGLSIISKPRATNFAVTAEQAAVIDELLRQGGPGGRPATKYDRAQTLANLIKAIETTGFIFEPWQIATYVTALRTKPFVILAGISGTGKSKLPSLVQSQTGGISCLVPVRPDWTDSSDVLGYSDLQGKFKEGLVLSVADEACRKTDQHFVCILDEMNLARVEQYFAEILSKIEDRRPALFGGFESAPLLSANLQAGAGKWSSVNIPPNLALVGTVNMDETAHGFSRKVLDRAFTIELSDVDLSAWGSNDLIRPAAAVDAEIWPVESWFPRAVSLATLADNLSENEQTAVRGAIETLIELNRYLSHAQLQVGYRIRDEISLFVLHALETPASFVTRSGTPVNTLDLAIQLKVLPRIVGGSSAIRRLLMQLIGWARTGKPLENDNQADLALEHWAAEGRPAAVPESRFPRTAAKLCLMWERLSNEGYTSFWL